MPGNDNQLGGYTMRQADNDLGRRSWMAGVGATLAALGTGRLSGLMARYDEGGPMQAIVTGSNRFGFELLRQLEGGNSFVSPTSIAAALGMTALGAKGETLEQMAQVLHVPAGTPAMDAGWKDLITGLVAEKPGRQVKLANRLFGHQGFTFLPDFTNRLASAFAAPMERVDYSNPEAARNRINGWVEENTNQLIKDLIPSGVLTPLTRLVLANAIHFKGDWLLPFTKGATRPGQFHVSGDKVLTLPLMKQTGNFRLRENDSAEALELPCKGNDRSVVFVLPKARHGLAELEKGLNAGGLEKLISGNAPNQRVELVLPRFEVNTSLSLKKTLSALGMAKAFADGADFSGMSTEDKSLKIDEVVHKAVLKVDEQGAEAAAATGVVIGVRSALPPREVRKFTVDQPFLVAIVDKATNAVLFMGRVREPKEKA